MKYTSLPNRIREILNARNLYHVILGISGGADSVALLHLLHPAVKIHAIHCNFHLRGEESMRDQHFCEELCAHLNIPLEVADFNVEEYCANQHVSTEKACRDLRYDLFRKRMAEYGCDRIAIAHNSDDQAETVLMNLFRGAGVRGLSGMQLDSGEIIRPLLTTSRAEILDYLGSLNQSYIIDSTNLESDYRRNFIRNEIFPLIETRWPAAKRKICESAEIMRDQVKLNDVISDTLSIGDTLSYDRMQAAPSRRWAIWQFAEKVGATPDIAAEIENSLESSDQVGKWWRIDYNTRIIRERDGLHIVRETIAETPIVYTESFEMNETLMSRIKSAPLTELWLPLSENEVEFRSWRIGDRIEPLGMHGSQLVSDIIKDAKLTTVQKEQVYVCVEKQSGRLLWVANLKRSKHCLISPTTPLATLFRLKSK